MKIIAFTGKCKKYTRTEFYTLLHNNDFIIQKNVCKNTDLVITDNPNSGTKKIQKAKEYGIEIITYNEFFMEYIPEHFI